MGIVSTITKEKNESMMNANNEHMPSEVEPYVLSAVEYIRRAVGLKIDLQVESLAVVDHYLKGVSGVDPAIVDLVGSSVGCYFGEMIRRYFDGRWRIEGGSPSGWMVDLAHGVSVCPVGMVAEAIGVGEVEGYDGSISVPRHRLKLLKSVLEGMGPVAVDVYYSLTNRLEVLEQVLDRLTALKEQKRSTK